MKKPIFSLLAVFLVMSSAHATGTDVAVGPVFTSCRAAIGGQAVSAQDLLTFFTGVYRVNDLIGSTDHLQISSHPRYPHMFRFMVYNPNSVFTMELDAAGEELDGSHDVVSMPRASLIIDTKNLELYKDNGSVVEFQYAPNKVKKDIIYKITFVFAENSLGRELKIFKMAIVEKKSAGQSVVNDLATLSYPDLTQQPLAWGLEDYNLEHPLWPRLTVTSVAPPPAMDELPALQTPNTKPN
jgi:hypothetical protein